MKLDARHRRSDTELARAAEHALDWDPFVPRESVTVKAENGWLTLSGEVDWDYQRTSAVNAVRGLLGVLGVTNAVKITGQPQPADIG